ncbi:hypothetical protein PGT21_023837 [Puccinia graminis f. sp. tritici]|uniref:Uncharacterized protein n=1 Tax=Puccinia graminis f. sp. tritici TaxID=56615 RepID=A0A5B0PNQ7_PUCGR|nr:hypothetical protein PGTUg99_010946 [Puccinia graminis f. sp. tritici]KAA1114801.1 hypothetical protein PGT21_023837 [Puccinia graminis f. sp. tritici]
MPDEPYPDPANRIESIATRRSRPGLMRIPFAMLYCVSDWVNTESEAMLQVKNSLPILSFSMRQVTSILVHLMEAHRCEDVPLRAQVIYNLP